MGIVVRLRCLVLELRNNVFSQREGVQGRFVWGDVRSALIAPRTGAGAAGWAPTGLSGLAGSVQSMDNGIAVGRCGIRRLRGSFSEG